MIKRILQKGTGILISTGTFLMSTVRAFAALDDTSGYANAQPLDISPALNVGWQVVKTIQIGYTIIAALMIIFLGIKLATSGDNTGKKITAITEIGVLIVGGILVWGGPWLAGLFNTATKVVAQ